MLKLLTSITTPVQVFDLHQLTEAAENYRRKNAISKTYPRDIANEGHIKLGAVFNNTAFYHEFGGSS